jgi:TM2 domain-containing membrane protein YozV
MSDESTSTGQTDSWAQADAPSAATEGSGTAGQTAGDTAAGENAARPVGFCQDCGRGLSAETLRSVGTGVFCEPCLEVRLRQGAGAYGAVPGTGQGTGAAQGYGGAPPGSYGAGNYGTGSYGTIPTPTTAIPGEPVPLLAGLLGLIPGVGAMYNGQFAKGVIHLIVFVILVFMSNNVSGVFGLFVAGWIFYQAFEAYHTAVARRDGLPLPNPFGFNDIGERMGFGKSWGGTWNPGTGNTSAGNAGAGNTRAGQAPGQPPPVTPWAESAAPVPPAGNAPPAPSGPNWAGYVPPPAGAAWTGYAPPAAASDWVGYVPPTAFASARPVNPIPPAAQAQQSTAPWGHAPYVETYTGAAGAQMPPGYTGPPFAPTGPGAPLPPARRFPLGALWLIGLGVLILLANLLPDWRISDRWWPPVLFAGLSLWLFTRRLHSNARLACILRWPVILMVLAVMFALHAAYVVVSFGMTCAVLLIAFGAMLLIERTLGAGPGYGGGYAAAGPTYSAPGHVVPGYVVPATEGSIAPDAPEPPRAIFTPAEPVAAESADPNDVAEGDR